MGQLMDRELPAMEEENILEHLDRLSQQDRDILDQLGAAYSIKDYYRMLRLAKRDQDDRVRQLKVTAVVSFKLFLIMSRKMAPIRDQ